MCIFISSFLVQEVDALAYGISCTSSRSEHEVVSSLLDPILEHPHVPLKSAPLRLFNIALDRSSPATLAWLDSNYDKLTVSPYFQVFQWYLIISNLFCYNFRNRHILLLLTRCWWLSQKCCTERATVRIQLQLYKISR